METYQNLPVLFFATQQKWRQWLHAHHTDPKGIWLKFAKKGTGIASTNYAEAVEVALCYGWIDGQSKSVDQIYYLQKFTPRRPKSVWSKINVAKVEKLIAEGAMQPAGLAAIQAAKDDGRWDQAYDPPSKTTMPPDFQVELDKNPKAKAAYAALNKTNTYAILWQIQAAKRPQTRQARIAKYISMLSNNQTLY